MGSFPGWGRFPGERNGNPLQNSYLENLMDRGAWRATVPTVAKSWTLKELSTQTGSTDVRDTSYKEKENSLRNTNSASVV